VSIVGTADKVEGNRIKLTKTKTGATDATRVITTSLTPSRRGEGNRVRLSAIAAVTVTMEKKSRSRAIARSVLSRATIAAVGDRKYLKIGRQAELLLNDLPAAADLIADEGYDAESGIQDKNCAPHSFNGIIHSKIKYKKRNLIERCCSNSGTSRPATTAAYRTTSLGSNLLPFAYGSGFYESASAGSQRQLRRLPPSNQQ
jgi:hypothetical protein